MSWCLLKEELEDTGFHWEDYTVLTAVLTVTCTIGAYYAFFGRKSSHASDFLTGGGTMSTLPTALSLATGFITAIELLGNPAEMYYHGSQFWMTCISFILVAPLAAYFYVPVFMKLRLTSSYEYLEMRFDKSTRYLASMIYVLQMVLYTSVAVYAPALALGHVTGLNTYIAVTVVYIVCIFYASLGGMRAVIMTDSFQTLVLMTSLLIVMFIGEFLAGGIGEVLEANIKSDRIELFNMDLDPTVRHTFWSVSIGGTFYWATMFCSNQASIQKYLSVHTVAQARRALWVTCVSMILIFSLNFYTGMIMYAQYQNCDPLLSMQIGAKDELLPFYVVGTQGHIRGLPGLFVSGIFAASLGTVGAAMNSLAAVSMEDILCGLLKMKIPESKGALVSQWLSVFFGVLSFILVFVVEQLGSVLQVALSFNGITGGITLGLFTLGMFFPWANTKGALSGAIVSLLMVGWLGVGTQVALALGFDPADYKPQSVDGCICNVTVSIQEPSNYEPWYIFQISYLWYSAIGFLLTVLIGAVVSLMTSAQDPCSLHPDLISPPVTALLSSLPNSIKERINLPLQSKDRATSGTPLEKPKSEPKPEPKLEPQGVDNLGLSLDSEVP